MFRESLLKGISLILFILLFSACKPVEDPEPIPSITFSNNDSYSLLPDGNVSASVSAEGGVITVSFNSAIAWTANCNENWCILSQASGSGGAASITLTVKPNDIFDNRYCTIAIQSGNIRKNVTLNQQACIAMLVSPTAISAPAEGGRYEISINSNALYSFTIETSAQSWLSVADTKGLTTSTVTITVNANKDTLSRTGTIFFNSVAGKDTVYVTQGGVDVFTVAPSEVRISGQGGTFDVTVTATRSYHLSSNPEWISEVSVASKVHTFNVKANDGKDKRTGVVVFCDDRGTCIPVIVKQDIDSHTDLSLSIAETELLFSDLGGTKQIMITSSIDWKVNAKSNWFSVSSTRGQRDGAITVSVVENPNVEARCGALTISASDGSAEYVVSVIQSGHTGDVEDEWKTHPFYHQSVAMRFTATWCGWCPRMNKSISKAQALYPDKIQHIALHGGGSDLQFSQIGPLTEQYAIAGFPTGIIDGRTLIQNYPIEQAADTIIHAAKETESILGTSSGVAIKSSYSRQKVSIDVDGYFKESGDYKINVLLLEDGIINVQSDYEEGNHDRYVHNNVVRMAVSAITGDPFTINKPTKKSFSYSVSVPAQYDLSNFRIFVYIQKKFKNNRLQSGNYGDYYIDNCATVAVGEAVKLKLVRDKEDENGRGNEGITPGGEII